MTYLVFDGILRAESDPTVIATLRRKGWSDAPPRPSEDAQWVDGAWVVPPPPSVPESVEARQLRKWLILNGHSIESIDSAIEAMTDDVQRQLTKNEWEYSTSYTRRHPMVEAFVRVTQMTDVEIDQAFREAALL